MLGNNVLALLSGRACTDNAFRRTLWSLGDGDTHIRLCEPATPDELTAAVRAASADGVESILVAGGDGTLNAVANVLYTAGQLDHVVLAAIPCGTGNDFAMHFGYAHSAPADALAAVLKAAPTPVDVVRVGDRIFLNAASGGIGARATAETDPALKQSLGKLAYFLTGATKAGMLRATPARFHGDEFSWSGDVLGFVVSNGRYAGGNVPVAPEARLDDGLLDLTVFPDLPAPDLAQVVASVTVLPGWREASGLVTARLPAVTIEADEGFHVNLDGEPKHIDSARFEVLPRAAQVQAPTGMA